MSNTIAKVICVLISLMLACQRLNSNEAKYSMQDIKRAEVEFRAKQGRYGSLRELSYAGLINPSVASGVHSGYRFYLKLRDDSYEAFAVPVRYNEDALKGTGRLSFYVNESGVIRAGVHDGKEANADDPALSEENQ